MNIEGNTYPAMEGPGPKPKKIRRAFHGTHIDGDLNRYTLTHADIDRLRAGESVTVPMAEPSAMMQEMCCDMCPDRHCRSNPFCAATHIETRVPPIYDTIGVLWCYSDDMQRREPDMRFSLAGIEFLPPKRYGSPYRMARLISSVY